jgi:4-hydroxybenzoate polyprenyltransferase
MKAVARSAHLYFWPIIVLNGTAMTWAVNGDMVSGLGLSVSIASLASFGFLFNDLCDRDVDRVNAAAHFENADRGLLRIAFAASCFFLILGLGGAVFLGRFETFVATSIAIGLMLYSLIARRFLLLPTILTAVLATSPLWAALLRSNASPTYWLWYLVVSMALIIAARETLMDTRDRVGDAVGGRETVATVFGPSIAKFVAVILTLNAFALLAWIVFNGMLRLPGSIKIAAFATALAMAYLIAWPTLQAFHATDERAAIQRYVLRSRVGMTLLPLLIILLWRL